MFCLRCGAQIPDDSVFCAKCGASVQAGSQPAPVDSAALEKKSKKGLVIGIIAAVLVLALVAGGAFLYLTSPYYVLSKYFDAYEDADLEAVLELAPEEYYEALEELYGDLDEELEELAESLEDEFDELDDEYDLGGDLKLSYKILGSRTLEDEEVDALQENFDEIGADLKIEKAKAFWIEITLKGKDNEHSGTTTMTLIKVDGKWYTTSLY